jgi:type I restriction enzyme S subunit
MTTQNKNVPAVRFSEFSEKWNFKNLENLSTNGFSNGIFNDPKKVGKGYKLINVKDMYVGDSIDISTLTLIDIDEKQFKRNKVEYGDIFFTRSSLVKEGIAHSNVNLSNAEDITFDGHIIRMRPNTNQIFPKFLAYLLKTSTARKQLIVRGKTTTMTTIGQEEIGTVVITFPTLPEQQKIAAFLTAVDEKIQQLTKKKDLLEQYKKGVMQQIFNQEIRFKDDNGNDFADWKEKKLKEIGKFNSGTGFTENAQGGKDGIPFYKVSDMNLEGNEFEMKVSNNYVSADQVRIYKYKPIVKPSIIFAKVGAAIFLERKRIAKDFLIDNNMMSFTPRDNILFIKYVFETLKLSRFAQVGALPSYNSSDIGIIKIKLPSKPEQKKIASFLSAIDDKINLVNQQLEKTQRFKKGLLQQMFV